MHHIEMKKIDLLNNFYKENKDNTLFNRVKFFSNVLLLIRNNYNEDYCKRLINDLITLEKDNS